MVKYTVEISQNFVAFSEYMNFIDKIKSSILTTFYSPPNGLLQRSFSKTTTGPKPSGKWHTNWSGTRQDKSAAPLAFLAAFLGFLASLGLVGLLRFLRAPKLTSGSSSIGASVSVTSVSATSVSVTSVSGASFCVGSACFWTGWFLLPSHP